MLTKILKTGLYSVGIATWTVSSAALANLKLSDFYVDLHENGRVDSIYASNQGREILFLKISVAEVVNPGGENQEVRKTASPKELGLLVSPQRLVVKPGEEGRIRMVAMVEPEQDRFYKITVEPVAGELQSKEQIGVKILVGYSAWAYVRPKGASPSVTGSREGNKLILTNNGSTLAQMMAGKICSAASSCEKIEPFRVQAGQQKTIDLPHENAPVSFRMTWGNKSEDLNF